MGATDIASMGVRRPVPEAVSNLIPLSSLSRDRLRELCEVSTMFTVARGEDSMGGANGHRGLLYLLRGELLLVFGAGGTEVIVGDTEGAFASLNGRSEQLSRTRAITEVELLQVDEDVVDVMMTWDQVAATAHAAGSPGAAAALEDSRVITGPFSLASLRSGVFSPLPSAHIDELLRCFVRVRVHPGDVVVREGGPGDYYYLIESGRFRVDRVVGGVKVVLAELHAGEAFGEEALVSGARRNATVTALAEGHVLRLAQAEFDRLLREPLLRRVDRTEADRRVASGALWVDVRYPSEFQHDRPEGAINVPLNEVRDMFGALDRTRDYVLCCQSGRRSAAAAFLLAQRGFNVSVLEGGLRGSAPIAAA